MPARSKDKRKEILRRLYHFCLFNIGTDDDGNMMRVRLPNYDNTIDKELRNKAASMTEEKWVSEASAAIDFYNRQRKVVESSFGEVKEKPINHTPMDELLPGFENEPKPEPMQTAIDFDKERIADNLGQLIVEVRRMADALETLSKIPDNDGYLWIKKGD